MDWSDGNTSNPRTDTNVTADKSVTANFAINTYNLTYATDAGGTITGDTHQSVAHGADGSAVTAVPAAGYTFLKWSDGVTTPSRTDTAVQSDLAVTATFQAIATYTITSSAGSNGSISPLGDRNLPAGGSQTYTVTPSVGYHVADVVVDGVSKGPVGTYTFSNVTAPHTISATFAINTYTIAPLAGPQGSISPSVNQIVNYGGSRTFTITPGTGYRVAKVNVDGKSVGSVTSYTFINVRANHTILVTFTRVRK